MREISVNLLIEALKSRGYIIYDRPYELNIVGIRKYFSRAGQFDDIIALFFTQPNGELFFNSYKATVDPGIYYLKNLWTPKGAAILMEGQYVNAYNIGMHNNKYESIVQKLRPVNIVRDKNKDNILDFDGSIERGMFGMNIHHASSYKVLTEIGKYSAGCQVIADIKDWKELMHYAYKHRELYGNKFTYTLINEIDIYFQVFGLKDVNENSEVIS